jgi:DNA-directed RNA polymerase beta subunit
VNNLRGLRRRGLAGEFVSFYLHEGQRSVHIATDGGRVCRPLIIVDEAMGLPRLKQIHLEALALGTMGIRDLLRQGLVEYVDCNEENNTLIAVTERDLEVARKQGLENRRMLFTPLHDSGHYWRRDPGKLQIQSESVILQHPIHNILLSF